MPLLKKGSQAPATHMLRIGRMFSGGAEFVHLLTRCRQFSVMGRSCGGLFVLFGHHLRENR